MHDGSGRIAVQNLSKQFGAVNAVQNLSFTVEPGSVTGFLGPNGAGKTTTLRMLLGLVTPTNGTATINGRPHDQLGNPARVVGSVLENEGFHPGRTARNHLRVYSAAIGMPDQRVGEVLGLVGLSSAADRKAGGFSLGMRQRLALATALLGDPQVLVLDEPTNGLDPEGILWLRNFLRAYAREGRTVLVSSHLLNEVEQTIDQVIIISQGMTRYNGSLDQLRKSNQSRVLVQSADANGLVSALQEAGITQVSPMPDGRVAVSGATVQQIGDISAKASIAVYGMQEETADLERMFFQLTQGQYAAPQPGFQQGPPPGYQGPPPGYQGPPPGYQGQPPVYAPQNTPPPGFAPPQQQFQHQPPQQQQYQQAPPQQQAQQQGQNEGWGGQG
ncbi:ABC transporter ATP-binding protein [Amycolatopsis coloradensis]|uniref:ABC transporter ATP-binding protein n=1 Tax=Amycolatopsis coloradensis TaxID=76021 RepID=A0A1R0KXH0_9PSEU|nr:ABC transporter ATP-binding protein [Amycolatopsis coloradensis]OLZ53683.1 ABC transporter ATP-binding protein [Amycolatopsis coloradensis]